MDTKRIRIYKEKYQNCINFYVLICIFIINMCGALDYPTINKSIPAVKVIMHLFIMF